MAAVKELSKLEDELEKVYMRISVAESTTKAVWLAHQEGLNRDHIDNALLGIGDSMGDMKKDMSKLVQTVIQIRMSLRQED